MINLIEYIIEKYHTFKFKDGIPVLTESEKEMYNPEEAILANNLKKIYIRDIDNNPIGVAIFDGMVTYGTTTKRKRVVNVAVSMCHDNDKFDKKLGTKLALDRFMLGQTIPVRVGIENPIHVLKRMFFSLYVENDFYD